MSAVTRKALYEKSAISGGGWTALTGACPAAAPIAGAAIIAPQTSNGLAPRLQFTSAASVGKGHETPAGQR
jgi:hypothetical protein